MGIELSRTTFGKVYNGITGDETHVDNLNQEVLGLLVCRVAARVISHASGRFSCFLEHASLVCLVGLVIKTAVLNEDGRVLTVRLLCQS